LASVALVEKVSTEAKTRHARWMFIALPPHSR
jgi:hypothetical protein